MTCPEPPAPGERFALAWLDGIWVDHHLPGERGLLEVGSGLIGLSLDLTAENIGFDIPRNDEFYTAEVTKAYDRMESAHNVPPSFPEASRPKELIKDLVERAGGDLGEAAAARAFYAGLLYSRKFVHSQSDQALAALMGSFNGWENIILEAFHRHGLIQQRKELLRKLGCLNVEDYRQKSDTILKFEWPFTDEIKCTTFHEHVKSALATMKSLERSLGQQISLAEQQNAENARAQENYRRRAKRNKENEQQVKLMESQRKVEAAVTRPSGRG